MPDYQPLDLSDLCNAGLDVLDEKPNTPIGDQLCRGLPFRVNDDPAKCFIAFDKASGGVTIPVNSLATGLILAHRLLKSDLMEGGPLGIPVAEYVFRLAGGKAGGKEGGKEIRVPIRERFEIGHISLGGKPFIALTDRGPVKMRRYAGDNWGDSGKRQTEVTGDYSRGYYLWAWRNPHPDREIESLEVIPAGSAFHHRRTDGFAGQRASLRPPGETRGAPYADRSRGRRKALRPARGRGPGYRLLRPSPARGLGR